MASTLADFTLSAVAAPDDFIVGYDEAALNGERRWTVSTIAKAVSGVASLGTVTNVTGTSPISVANGTTTPAISIAAATTSSAGSMSSTDKTRLDDASGVNGIVKCNGSGDFSAAVAGTDYISSVSLSASPTSAKAWVNFNGTGAIGSQTIRSSYNVSSVTKNGNGNYTINFSTPMADADYSWQCSSQRGDAVGGGTLICGAFGTASNSYTSATTSSLKIASMNDAGSLTDPLAYTVIIFGN